MTLACLPVRAAVEGRPGRGGLRAYFAGATATAAPFCEGALLVGDGRQRRRAADGAAILELFLDPEKKDVVYEAQSLLEKFGKEGMITSNRAPNQQNGVTCEV